MRQNAEPPSTNISSPVHASRKSKGKARRAIQSEDEEDLDEEQFEDNNDGDSLNDNEGYEDDEEEEAFEPVPPHRRAANWRQQTLGELGPPISRDTRLENADIDEIHRDIMHAFIEQAKELDSELRIKEGIRRAIFNEQEYREMVINWTTSVSKIHKIRGIDSGKVEKYGVRFASLVRHYHAQYQEMMDATMHAPRDARSRDVVDLISSDAEMESAGAARDNYDYNDGDENESDEVLERSRFFGGPSTGGSTDITATQVAEAQEWRAEFKRLEQAATTKSTGKTTADRRGGDDNSTGSRSGYGYVGSSRRGRGGSKQFRNNKKAISRAGSQGVTKRGSGASKRTSSTGRHGASGRGGASGGIALMPH